MKKTLLTAALCIGVAVPALAAPEAQPMVSRDTIVADTAASSAGILVPIVALIMFALVAKGGSHRASLPSAPSNLQ
ncbi:MAG: hypothetical protein JXJ18_11040 [Rhodobacteraceae bacterium]|nr:hypothetical protein [Paracoccaceae bacterium]